MTLFYFNIQLHIKRRCGNISFTYHKIKEFPSHEHQNDSNTEITVAAGRLVFWNSLHISESEKLHKAVYNDYKEPLPIAELSGRKLVCFHAGRSRQSTGNQRVSEDIEYILG